MQVVAGILRVAQLLFAVIVLGLSVSLAKGQGINNSPAGTNYAAFTGGLGIVASFVGIAALFVESLQPLISGALDLVSSLAFLAGGIAYAVLLRGTNCSDANTTWNNEILSGGCVTHKGEQGCWYAALGDAGKLQSRCNSAKADLAFMFIDFAICIGVCAYVFLRSGN